MSALNAMNFTRNYFYRDFVNVRTRKLHHSCPLLKSKRPDELNRPSEKLLQRILDQSSIGSESKLEDQRWLSSPYGKQRIRDQAEKSLRPKIDPRETSIILFPGQGAQHVGMGKLLLKIPAVETMFKDASEILKYDLLKLCLEGPKHELDQTVYCQPAIYVASLGALQLMIEERQDSVETCVATAGFSVGEYAALVLANSLSFETGLKLVKRRAEAMQAASEMVSGGMMTLFLDPGAKIGTILQNALDWCKRTGVENPVCSVANYLYPHCRVVAGHKEALKFIEDESKELKIRRCRRIPVSGAFHTDLMKPAAEEFANVLKKYTINDPEISVHSNVDGLAYRDAKDIKKKLVKQIYRPVRWEQTLHILYDRQKGVGFPQTFELGPGKSLTTLLRYANSPAAEGCVNVLA